jgi:hypothetical protein
MLAVRVAAGGESKPFGELSRAEVERHAATLSEATGFGHRSRVGAVAVAWRELGRRMDEEGAARVSELEPETVAGLAERLWVVPPGGSLL